MEISELKEEYIEYFYRLEEKNGKVEMSEISSELDRDEESVKEMLEELEEDDLINQTDHSSYDLTEKGEKIALDNSPISKGDNPTSEEKKSVDSLAKKSAGEITKFLGGKRNKHRGQFIEGDEIPDSEEGETINLSEGEKGKRYRVVSVPEEKDKFQRLVPLAILPGTRIKLSDNAPSGTLLIEKGDDSLALSRSIGSKIKVTPDERRKRHRHRSGW